MKPLGSAPRSVLPEHVIGCLPLLVLPGAALLTQSQLPAWGFMGAMTLALYAGCKWFSWWTVRKDLRCPGLGWTTGYLLLWPGMDARTFFQSDTKRPPVGPIPWAAAVICVALGLGLLFRATPLLYPAHPIAAAWVGWGGGLLILHFGAFHLAALGWRRAGRDARPLMNAPWGATSLGAFWTRHWNAAFPALVREPVFRPIARRWGTMAATVAVFGLSGLAHEAVISLPAKAGHGLPTIYFLLQASGILVQRSRWARAAGLERGALGWGFTMLLLAGPARLLFHDAFMDRVVLPLMETIGAVPPSLGGS